MSDNLEDIKLRISNFMSLYFENEGFSPLVGKLYTLLMFSTEPISLQEMAEELSVSKAAVSVQIRTMQHKHLCYKIPIQNDRKDYYYLCDDIGGNMVSSYSGKMKSIQQAVEGALAALSEQGALQQEDGNDYSLIIQRFNNIMLLCDMFISRINDLNEEWLMKRQVL